MQAGLIGGDQGIVKAMTPWATSQAQLLCLLPLHPVGSWNGISGIGAEVLVTLRLRNLRSKCACIAPFSFCWLPAEEQVAEDHKTESAEPQCGRRPGP